LVAIWAADVCSLAARQLICIEPRGLRLRHIGKTDQQCGTVQFCFHSGRLTCSARTGFRAVTTHLPGHPPPPVLSLSLSLFPCSSDRPNPCFDLWSCRMLHTQLQSSPSFRWSSFQSCSLNCCKHFSINNQRLVLDYYERSWC